MTTRRMLLLASALAVSILAAGVLIRPRAFFGLLRGEAAYKGVYTNQWRAEIERWSVLAVYKPGTNTNRRIWGLKPEEGLAYFQDGHLPGPLHDTRLLDRDPDAIPVLLELLRDKSPKVRLVAAQGLGNIGAEAKVAVPALQETLKDADPEVSDEAAWALALIEGK